MKSCPLRRPARPWRRPALLLIPLLVLGLLAPLAPSPLGHPPAAQAASQVRWGFYVTYNPNSWTALQAHVGALNVVSPWYYSVSSGGWLTGYLQPQVNDLLRTRGVKNLPMVRNSFGYDNVHPVLADPAKRTSLVNQLHDLVQRDGYDGMTIDFEAINASDRPFLTAFMTALSQDFHGMGKQVAMAVPAKTQDSTGGWSGAYDYAALQPWADYFVVMGYDEHYPGGGPGPIAPLPWLNTVANYVGSALGAGKVVWGIGVYGYDWNTSANPRPMADPRTWGEVQTLGQQFGGTFAYDPTNQEPSLVYTQNNQRHEVWYENAQSFSARLALVQGRNFAGFALWRLGQEDPGIWATLAGRSGACAPIAPFQNSPTRLYFPQTGHSLGGGFLQYWQAHGGLAIYGYPLTEEFAEVSPTNGKTYTVQYFERNRFEYHPELVGTPYAVQLGLLGVQYTGHQLLSLTVAGAPAAGDTPYLLYFPETGHRLGGGFLQYWWSTGGLAQFGYPIGEDHPETSPTDGQTYNVQYFERARFEWHPEHQGTPYAVQLGLLGTWALQQRGCPNG